MKSLGLITLQEFILWAFGSDNPAVVGLAVLCTAVSIQQLDSKIHESIIQRLPRLTGELFQELFKLVDTFIVNDSEFACSREGIEVILMSAKILMNLGLIKKCWILNHRAVSYAQLLGLHRPQRLSAKESDYERTNRHQAWLSISHADVLLSLLLGLPYATDGRTIPAHMQGKPGTTLFFQHQLIRLAGRVIDKTQMGYTLSAITTQDIQNDIDSVVSQMPEDFWDVRGALAAGTITETEYCERLAPINFYYLIKVFLHMPLMIQSLEDSHLGAHKQACLLACRESLVTYQIMRSESGSVFSMIKVIDYQAFICASLLLLGIMGYGQPCVPLQNYDSQKDMDLVHATLYTLRQASMSSNNAIASQAVQGLESLTFLASGKACPAMAGGGQNGYARIVVPYSGTITISPGSFYANRHPDSVAQELAAASGPIFTLSYGSPEPYFGEGSKQIPSNVLNTGAPDFTLSGEQDFGSGFVPEYPYIDFDWGNMINTNTEEDWAWLMDVNNNTMSGIM